MKKLINLINKFLFYIRKKQIQTHKEKINKVIVLSNTALGDTILSTPVVKTLKKSFPDIYIVFMINKTIYPLFKDYEYVDKVLTYNKSFWGIIKHILYFRKNKFDSIFLAHSNGPQDLFIALASNIPNIHKAINYPNKVSYEFLKLIKNNVYSKKYQHIIEHRLDTVRYLNPPILDLTIDIPKKFYKNITKNDNKFTIGFQLGAADIYKMWPIDNFIKLANKLIKFNNKITIVLLGIRSERELAHRLLRSIKDNKRVINYCEKTTITELPILINSLDLLITNDTGTLHLSIALKKSSISLFSPTDAKIFGPYQDFNKHIVIQKNGNFINSKPKKDRNQDAMKLITVEEVYENTIKQINRIKKCVV